MYFPVRKEKCIFTYRNGSAENRKSIVDLDAIYKSTRVKIS